MPHHPAFSRALDFAARQCRRLIEMHPGVAPMYTVNGRWGREPELWTHWCEGFYPGIFWLLHEHTGDPFWRQHAEAYTVALAPRRFDRRVHDLGFLFLSTYRRWFDLTGDPALRAIITDAARTLSLRRQMGGYLASFIGPESLFIDVMMNVGLLFWPGDATLRAIALEHTRTTQRHLVRLDGGTAHEGLFDATTGHFLRESTHQGHAPDSTWSRGLAWAIYGFTTVHRLSGEPEFLATARRCADCYLRRCPPDLLPPWDFDAPAGGPRDSSAAAITACGLFDLAAAANEPHYRAAALTILETLCGPAYLADARPDWEGILLHGVYHLPKGLGVDESVAWGDHFFVEALLKAEKS